MSKLLKNTKYGIFLPQRPQNIDFDSLYPQITDFFGPFYDSDTFFTQYDVMWHHNWRHLISFFVKITVKAQNPEILFP